MDLRELTGLDHPVFAHDRAFTEDDLHVGNHSETEILQQPELQRTDNADIRIGERREAGIELGRAPGKEPLTAVIPPDTLRGVDAVGKNGLHMVTDSLQQGGEIQLIQNHKVFQIQSFAVFYECADVLFQKLCFIHGESS